MNDTATPEGREKRLNELVDGHIKNGNFPALIRLVGLSNSDRDYDPADEGMHRNDN